MSDGLQEFVSGAGRDRPTHLIVAEAIRRQIALGRLRPGDSLPSERDLSQQLGVGRTTLRQAIRMLAAEGWVDTKLGRGGGTVVLEAGSAPWEAVPGTVDLFKATVEHTYEFRLALEPAVAAAAASRATKDQVRVLYEILERPARTVHAYHSLDSRLHTQIAEASGNPLMLDAVENSRAGFFAWANALWLNADWRGLRIERSDPKQDDVGQAFEADHGRIVAAIAAGDPADARSSMERHLTLTIELFEELLERVFVAGRA